MVSLQGMGTQQKLPRYRGVPYLTHLSSKTLGSMWRLGWDFVSDGVRAQRANSKSPFFNAENSWIQTSHEIILTSSGRVRHP